MAIAYRSSLATPIFTGFSSSPPGSSGCSCDPMRGCGCGPGLSGLRGMRGLRDAAVGFLDNPNPIRYGLGQNNPTIIDAANSWLCRTLGVNCNVPMAGQPTVQQQLTQWAPYLIGGYILYRILK